jgi:hypothetical protein
MPDEYLSLCANLCEIEGKNAWKLLRRGELTSPKQASALGASLNWYAHSRCPFGHFERT